LNTRFQIDDPSAESEWRALILFGKNTATYKFAFAKTLLEFVKEGKDRVTLEELSQPFALSMSKHLVQSSIQGTNNSASSFIKACLDYNDDKVSLEHLAKITQKEGFKYVIGAFQNLNNYEIKGKFYEKNFVDGKKELILTDKILKLKESNQFGNLNSELEARWDLVETAWNLNLPANLIDVKYDKDNGFLFLEDNLIRRKNVSVARDSLSGYQKGKCFYSDKPISLQFKSFMPDVDHFFPDVLKKRFAIHKEGINVDGVWNLVLADSSVNVSKNARIPCLENIEKLFDRNEYYIESKHPLAETIVNQTGKTPKKRELFFQNVINFIQRNGLTPEWRYKE
jgi:hypothetical protein